MRRTQPTKKNKTPIAAKQDALWFDVDAQVLATRNLLGAETPVVLMITISADNNATWVNKTITDATQANDDWTY